MNSYDFPFIKSFFTLFMFKIHPHIPYSHLFLAISTEFLKNGETIDWPEKKKSSKFDALIKNLLHPLNSDINMHILLTVLHMFHMIALRRIC